MSGKCWPVAAAILLLAAPAGLAQAPAPDAAATGTPPVATGRSGQWPVTLSSNEQTSTPALAAWSQQEVEAAQARCAALLKHLTAVTVAQAPLREGSECGTP